MFGFSTELRMNGILPLSLLMNSVEKPNKVIQFSNTAKLLAMFEVIFLEGRVLKSLEWFCAKGVYIAFWAQKSVKCSNLPSFACTAEFVC